MWCSVRSESVNKFVPFQACSRWIAGLFCDIIYIGLVRMCDHMKLYGKIRRNDR